MFARGQSGDIGHDLDRVARHRKSNGPLGLVSICRKQNRNCFLRIARESARAAKNGEDEKRYRENRSCFHGGNFIHASGDVNRANLINQPFFEPVVSVDAAIAQERPVGAVLVYELPFNIGENEFLLVD